LAIYRGPEHAESDSDSDSGGGDGERTSTGFQPGRIASQPASWHEFAAYTACRERQAGGKPLDEPTLAGIGGRGNIGIARAPQTDRA
jgi:hypothetical protein